MKLTFRRPTLQPVARALSLMLAVLVLAELWFYAGAAAAPWLEARNWYFHTDTTHARVARWRREQYRREHDPPVGIDLQDLSLRSVSGRPVRLIDPRARLTAILFLDDPATCGSKSLLATWSELRKSVPGLRILVFARRVVLERDPLCHRPMPAVTLVGDPGGHVAELLNAGWRPRAYVVDRSGRLRYVQPETRLDGEAAADVGDLLKRGF